LGDDQLGELVGDIGVRSLKRRADDGSSFAKQRLSGFVGRLECAAISPLQEVGAVETGERDFGEIEVTAVGIIADDATVGADANRGSGLWRHHRLVIPRHRRICRSL
jgi:hypothetical protein